MERQTLRPETYIPRIADAQIERYLELFGAVEVAGAKWCGKTWSSLAHGKSIIYVDRGANLSICEADPAYALSGLEPHVIDEWQRVPMIWDTVRHAVDEGAGAKGRWLLTGSSTPAKHETSHSGAGRIGRVRMWPCTLQESGDSVACVSLSKLFEGAFERSQCPSGIESIAALAVRGGWPDLLQADLSDAQAVLAEYLDAVFEQSIPRLGGNALTAERLALSCARNIGQSCTNATYAKDVFAISEEGDVSDGQILEVSRHLELLSRVYLIDAIPGWVPASRSPARMRIKPKYYFADPSLAIVMLGLNSASLLQDWQTFGLVFENLCMRDLQVYAQALGDAGRNLVKYYRDDSGLEVDAIIERRDGRWGAFEIKLSETKVEEGAKALLRMTKKVLKNQTAKVREPSFLAVLTAMGEAPYQRPDGVFVIPLRSLGA